ncbi:MULTISPECIES: hypothetical protein [Actinomycetes]|uniref:hypothetical protein n=1 Tax=Micromonospora sp. NPDC005367 TaxID=3155590 RepID=UPI0033B975BD
MVARNPKNKPTAPNVVEDDFVTEVDGIEIRLPSLANLPFWLTLEIEQLSQTRAIKAILDAEVADEKARNAVMALRTKQLNELLIEWRTHSGINEGESSAS